LRNLLGYIFLLRTLIMPELGGEIMKRYINLPHKLVPGTPVIECFCGNYVPVGRHLSMENDHFFIKCH